ncbi:MAG: GTP-binding protein [Rhizobiales bacterium 35-68-8]|nr:MAG: GTP-binding protein [Rhizobiales bacterium 35-68-8]
MTHFRDMRTPVTLLTGFLGSGKTTLLNGWLQDPALSDAAVIVNEFGEIGIDHALIAASSDNTIELSTGCLCCTVKGDLVETLRDLTEKRARGEVKPFARVIIETTGLADPGPVIQALITFPVARTYRLGRIVTAVDSVQGMGTLDRHAEARKQVGVADEIVLTKADLGRGDFSALTARLAALAPGAGLHESALGRLAQPALLDGIDPADPRTRPVEAQAWLRAEAFENSDPVGHREDVGSFCLAFDAPLHWEHVSAWLDALVIAHGDDLLRVKGILAIAGRPKPVVVQAVQRLFSPPAELSAWPEGFSGSRIVFITRGLSRDYVTEVLDVIRSRPVRLDLAS